MNLKTLLKRFPVDWSVSDCFYPRCPLNIFSGCLDTSLFSTLFARNIPKIIFVICYLPRKKSLLVSELIIGPVMNLLYIYKIGLLFWLTKVIGELRAPSEAALHSNQRSTTATYSPTNKIVESGTVCQNFGHLDVGVEA